MEADFQAACRELDIVVQRSIPYKNHQLGRMEREWRTLSDTTTAMLDDSMLGNQFWGNAFLTAVYVRNRVWSQSSHCIPYHVVLGKLPNLSNLRGFGCQVFSHIDKSKHRKLGKKSSEGIFVGYPSDCLSWLVYNPSTRSITRRDRVVFNDQWKPHGHGQSTKCDINETKIQVKTPRNFASSGDVNNSRLSIEE